MPMVSKSKWLEPRHMVNVTDRFTRDKTDSLQHAFFNGQGYATLENLWGFWYGMTPHDAEAILRFTRIERAFAENLHSPDWEPHVPDFASRGLRQQVPRHDRTRSGRSSIATSTTVRGEQLRVRYQVGMHYYDLWHGTRTNPGDSRTTRRR